MRTRGAFSTFELGRKDFAMHCQGTFPAFGSSRGADIPSKQNDSVAKVPGFLLRRPLKKKLADCDESVLKSLARSMKLQDNRPAVEQITVPITYFYADPGSLFSPKLADWYREHVPTQYNAVCFPNSTHMLVSDYPEKFAKEVGRMLYK